MAENETVVDKVKGIIVEALSLDGIEEVDLHSRLIQDLGAESIDFIDISFRIEKEFGLSKVSVNDVFPFAYLGKELIDASGALIPAEVEEIREEYPHIDEEALAETASKGDKSFLFTVYVLYKYVAHHTK